MFITNRIIPGCNLEILAFVFPFGGVAKQSLAKLQNNRIRTTKSMLLKEEAVFEFFLPKDVL